MTPRDMINKNQDRFERLSAHEVLKEALFLFGADRIALASSLAAEDQVLTDMLITAEPNAKIFTIDTGRLPQETYNAMQATAEHYGFKYEVLFPDYKAVEKMISSEGPNLFYKRLELRQLCCGIRKVEPLRRRLRDLEAWICGLRRDQAVTRADIKKIEWDAANGLIKINPIADWSVQNVWDYIRERKIPYNTLHDKGYTSIGCAPCTRPIETGQDIRAGRWWWENPEHKECGLHDHEARKKDLG